MTSLSLRWLASHARLAVLLTGLLAVHLALGAVLVVPPGVAHSGVEPQATLVTAPPASADSNVLYVAQGGSNAGGNNCQVKVNPCATITYALTVAGSSPTFHVQGTVLDNIASPGRPIVIDGLDAPASSPAVIDGNGAGRVLVSGWPVTLRGVTITGGRPPQHGNGGGLVLDGGSIVLDRVRITGNQAGNFGGGLMVTGDLVVTDSVISDNRSGNDGAGLYLNSGSLDMQRSTVSGNVASAGRGGGISLRDTHVTAWSIIGSTVSGNSAPSDGGGLAVPGLEQGVIQRTTIVDNSSGLYVAGTGTSTVLRSTISGNRTRGVAAYNIGKVRVAGSIVSGNGTDCSLREGNWISGGRNYLGEACPAAANDAAGATPDLGPLRANGGPTPTRMPDAGSPVVAKIPAASTAFGTNLCGRDDQRGVSTPAAGRTQCTIGAVEVGSVAPATFTTAASATATAGSPVHLDIATLGPLPYLGVAAATPLPAGLTLIDNRDGTATLAGSVATPDTYTFTLTADNGVPPTTTQAFTLTVKTPQAPLVVTSVDGIVGSPVTLTASGGSGSGAVAYALDVGASTGCTLSGSQLTRTTVGTCRVTATKAGDATYGAGSSAPTVVTFRTNQAVLTVTSTNGVVGTPLPLTSTGGSGGGAVSYAVVDAGTAGCTILSGSLRASADGSCTVTATKAADATYLAGTSEPTIVRFKRHQPGLTVSTGTGSWATGQELRLSGGAGDGAVGYVVADGTARACRLDGATLRASSAGTCVVTATKQGDLVYLPATSTATPVTLAKAEQAPLRLQAASGTAGTPIALAATGGSGTGAVTFTATDGTARGCTVSGATLQATSPGTCAVVATKAEDSDYRRATSGSPELISLGSVEAPPGVVKTATELHVRADLKQVKGMVKARFRVTVLPVSGAPRPTGEVVIKVGDHVRCTIAVVGGNGECFVPVRKLKKGTVKVVAIYGGSALHLSSRTKVVRRAFR